MVSEPTCAITQFTLPGVEAVVQARAYGTEHVDLDIVFANIPRPMLISQVLACCTRDAHGAAFDVADLDQWNVNQRLHALQQVSTVSEQQQCSVQLACAACGETMELELNLADFDTDEHASVFTCRPDDATVLRIRLPTGADQIAWLQAASDGADALQRTMATRLVLDINGQPVAPEWEIPLEWIDAVAGILEQHDRGNMFDLQTQCPACDHDEHMSLDLEASLLARLQMQQGALLEEIHQLASAYHWTERDVLALTPQRRRYYVARIHGEMGS